MPSGKFPLTSLTLSFLKDIHSHGLSYTTFDLADLTLSQPIVENGEFHLSASVKVTNTGSVLGSEVVQLYISFPTTSDLTHPKLQLKGFAKVYDLAPGASQTVDISLDKYAVSYWSELYDTWTVENGVYIVEVGSASDKLSLEAMFQVKTGFEWTGL
jgi:beta-glucosidase